MIVLRFLGGWGSQLALHVLIGSSILSSGAVVAQELSLSDQHISEAVTQALNPVLDSQPILATGAEPLFASGSQSEKPLASLASVSTFRDESAPASASSLGWSGSFQNPTIAEISQSEISQAGISQADISQADISQADALQAEILQPEAFSSEFRVNPASPSMKRLVPVSQLSSEGSITSADAFRLNPTSSQTEAQVTSVSQLSDVQPTDWAFQALQSLIERYGCIAGYPNKTYRGNRSLTRYEFAAGLNACMDRVNELIASATADAVKKEDLDAIKKLQDDFATELAALRGRVEAVDGRTKILEAQQFSTTTKLRGLAWFNLTGAIASNRVKVETVDPVGRFGRIELRFPGRDPVTQQPIVSTVGNPQVTFSNLVWLSLETSFTGKDLLVTQLVAGNGESPANVFASSGAFNTFGVPFTDQTAGVQGLGNQVVIRELFYSFPVTKNLQIVAGPRVNWYRYFDNNAFGFFLNDAVTFNSIGSTLTNTFDRGSGVVALLKINDKFKFHVGYLAENTEFLPAGIFQTSSDPRKGLFGGTWTATAELTYSPTKKMNFRLLYNRSQIQALDGLIGGVTGEPLQNGLADAGPGRGLDVNPTNGGLRDSQANTVGLSFDWLIHPRVGIFGRYGFGNTRLQPIKQDVNVQSFQAGIALPDLGKKGAMGSISFLVPFDVLSGKRFLVSGIGDGGTQYEFEASYFMPLNQYLAIVPAFYTIIHPNNFDSNPAIFVGNIRTQFSF